MKHRKLTEEQIVKLRLLATAYDGELQRIAVGSGWGLFMVSGNAKGEVMQMAGFCNDRLLVLEGGLWIWADTNKPLTAADDFCWNEMDEDNT